MSDFSKNVVGHLLCSNLPTKAETADRDSAWRTPCCELVLSLGYGMQSTPDTAQPQSALTPLTSVIESGNDNATACARTEKETGFRDGENGETVRTLEHATRHDLELALE